jgi:hypothetical protein
MRVIPLLTKATALVGLDRQVAAAAVTRKRIEPRFWAGTSLAGIGTEQPLLDNRAVRIVTSNPGGRVGPGQPNCLCNRFLAPIEVCA